MRSPHTRFCVNMGPGVVSRLQRIQERAYELWEAERRRHGNDLAHWFQAEKENPLRVTFDTNTFDKVSRPALYSKDQDRPEMVEVHNALKSGDIQGFICDAPLTLEGIGVDDRATVFRGTVARSSIAQVSEDTFSTTVTPEQSDRRPVRPRQAERFAAAFSLGVRLLGEEIFPIRRSPAPA